jgi:hypothetical protein
LASRVSKTPSIRQEDVVPHQTESSLIADFFDTNGNFRYDLAVSSAVAIHNNDDDAFSLQGCPSPAALPSSSCDDDPCLSPPRGSSKVVVVAGMAAFDLVNAASSTRRRRPTNSFSAAVATTAGE